MSDLQESCEKRTRTENTFHPELLVAGVSPHFLEHLLAVRAWVCVRGCVRVGVCAWVVCVGVRAWVCARGCVRVGVCAWVCRRAIVLYV